MDFEIHVQARGHEWILGMSRVGGSKEAISATQRNSSLLPASRCRLYRVRCRPHESRGHIGEVAIQKNGALHGSLAYKEASPGLELNDMGFQGRADYRALSVLTGYQHDKAGKLFRDYLVYAYGNQAWNFGGTSILRSAAMGAQGGLNNFWYVGVSAGFNPSYYSDRFTRGGPRRGACRVLRGVRHHV